MFQLNYRVKDIYIPIQCNSQHSDFSSLISRSVLLQFSQLLKIEMEEPTVEGGVKQKMSI